MKKPKQITNTLSHLPPHIYCCGCEKDVFPRLTNGSEIYPWRPDLKELPFWKCDKCGNYVGCHHKAKSITTRIKPLGCIPTPEIRNARSHIHALIDPAWKSGKVTRGEIYEYISYEIGQQFHTADIRSVDMARLIYKIARTFLKLKGAVSNGHV